MESPRPANDELPPAAADLWAAVEALIDKAVAEMRALGPYGEAAQQAARERAKDEFRAFFVDRRARGEQWTDELIEFQALRMLAMALLKIRGEQEAELDAQRQQLRDKGIEPPPE